MVVTENQPMLPSASALEPQFAGAQFMDTYTNYGASMTGIPYNYDAGSHNSFDMVLLPNASYVAKLMMAGNVL